MGTSDVAKIDLATLGVGWIRGVGGAPRHLVMDPAGQFLYATLNGDGQVAKIDLATDAVVARVTTGNEPRSMTIAPDGRRSTSSTTTSSAVSKLDAADLHRAADRPHQLASHRHHLRRRRRSRVWVACYSGEIMVFDDA